MKFFSSMIASITAITSVYAWDWKNMDTLVEAKAGYFFPSNDRFEDIYGGSGIYGVEITSRAWRNIYLWASASYFTRDGHSIGEHDHTKVYFVPIAAGVKYFYPIHKYLDAYVGVGGVATYLHTKDNSPFVQHERHKWGGGVIGKGGFIINAIDHVFFDVFGDYTYTRIDFDEENGCNEGHRADISGGSIGLGVGYRF